MARPRKVSTTMVKPSTLSAKGKTPPKGRASLRKATPSAKLVDSEATDSVRDGRVTKTKAAKRATPQAKRSASPDKRASPAKRAASPAKRLEAPTDPTLLIRLARSSSPAKSRAASPARADLKSPSPGPHFTGEGSPEIYTRWDLEQFTPNVNAAIKALDGGMKGGRTAWSLLRKNLSLDGNSKAGETDSAKEGRALYRKLKKVLKTDMGPEFDEAWKMGLSAAQLGHYLKSTGEDIQEVIPKPVASPPRGRPIAPRSPGKAGKVQEGRVTKSKSPSKVRSPSKAPSPSKTQSQSPLKKIDTGDSGVVIVDQTKRKRPQSPAKPTATTKGKGKSASPARPYQDNRGCLPHTRGKVESCTNLEFISDEKGKHNPFFETLPAPEVWHRRMPPYFPFGETPLMEAYVSKQIDEDLQRGVAHDEEVQNKNRSVVGRVFNAGQKAATSVVSMVWKRSEDRRYPPAWSLPEVNDEEIAVFARLGNGKAIVGKRSKV
ncbi:hypothetical protein LTR95_012933 [Oleoguttula sp. CCFEE 5521]